MTKQEVISFTNKIRAYYKTFSIDNEEALQEWINVLSPYRKEDILKRFDNHLRGEDALKQPMLHLLIRNLMTEEEQNNCNVNSDYIIRCDLCGIEMSLSTYNKSHRNKCLLIKALIPILKSKGENVDYDTLNKYDEQTLEKIWMKYVPLVKSMEW